jgi:aspartyl/asparaginyl-tRNA synthetase
MILLRDLFAKGEVGAAVTARGWVRTKRDLKSVVFVEVNDGSCLANLQCTFNRDNRDAGLSPETEAALGKAVSLYNTRRPHLSLNYETPETMHRWAA